MIHLKETTACCLFGFLFMITLSQCSSNQPKQPKPRILVSTDIGGTDPDDYQSVIHLLMYADLFQIEGLISSPFGEGRKQDLLDMIDLYEKDFMRLREHASDFPDPDYLRSVCKQGAVPAAPFKGCASSTEGSDWIIRCAGKESDQPLWVLVWGGIEDVAQALHDAPEIKENIRVYWIGGPNKKWSVNAYSYIADHHPDLWMIEANATYRGWFLDEESPEDMTNETFYENYMVGAGAMGRAFKNYYKGILKMGDTPSLAYLMDGDPEDPLSESWGGQFAQISHSSRYLFERNTTISDTVVAYGTMEWRFSGPDIDIPSDSVCFTLEISNQVWPGYYLGDGVYGVRYSSKKPENCTYLTASDIPELNGRSGQFVSIVPWPGDPAPNDYKLGMNWYSDRPEPEFFLGEQQGAKTVSRHRQEFLSDWAARWEWLR
jgi:hypothetical protein